MKCPKCIMSYKNNDVEYCPRCGYYFKVNDKEFVEEPLHSKMVGVYYPDEEVNKRNYNIWFALFSFFYAVYKRMYNCALYTYIAFFISMYLLPKAKEIIFNSGGFTFFVVIFTILGCFSVYLFYVFKFDRLLMDKRFYKINNFIDTYNNDEEKVREAVLKDKKGNVVGVIITIVLVILIWFVNKVLFSC